MRPALRRPPCGVAFSGGRDSSLILAIATHVARSEGLDDPVPITRRFPDVAETDEATWQELVVRHLGLREWERLEFRDELDVIGPIAGPVLRVHGVLWPPSFASDLPLIDAVAGGALLDGEGGDEVLGVESHRIAPIALLRQRPVNRWRVRRAFGAVAPARLRVQRIRRRRLRSTSRWLLPGAWSEFMDVLDEVDASAPLSYAASVRMVPRRRTQMMASRTAQVLAARRDVVVRSPLIDARFITALAAEGGILGPGDRTAALRALAGDLLPDELLSRTGKATFTLAYMGEPTRAFARDWDGSGLDTSVADPNVLRSLWLSGRPPAPTSSLLQAAWLAAHDDSNRGRSMRGTHCEQPGLVA